MMGICYVYPMAGGNKRKLFVNEKKNRKKYKYLTYNFIYSNNIKFKNQFDYAHALYSNS